MANFEFKDYTVKAIGKMEEALIAGLEEAAGEIEARTIRNSRQGHSYGDIQARALWITRWTKVKRLLT